MLETLDQGQDVGEQEGHYGAGARLALQARVVLLTKLYVGREVVRSRTD